MVLYLCGMNYNNAPMGLAASESKEPKLNQLLVRLEQCLMDFDRHNSRISNIIDRTDGARVMDEAMNPSKGTMAGNTPPTLLRLQDVVYRMESISSGMNGNVSTLESLF